MRMEVDQLAVLVRQFELGQALADGGTGRELMFGRVAATRGGSPAPEP